MTKSTNLQMNKPEYSDQYDLQHWNENTDILDNAYNSIVNTGDTVVKKAQQDESGNNIKSTYATKSELNDAKSKINTSLGQKEVTANKVSAWQSTPDNTHYPTEKLVKDNLDNKSNVGHTHTKSQITDFPSSMPASDVYSWAKSSSKPSYSISEISGLQNALDGKVNANQVFKVAYLDMGTVTIRASENNPQIIALPSMGVKTDNFITLKVKPNNYDYNYYRLQYPSSGIYSMGAAYNPIAGGSFTTASAETTLNNPNQIKTIYLRILRMS